MRECQNTTSGFEISEWSPRKGRFFIKSLARTKVFAEKYFLDDFEKMRKKIK
jgi:hypothetical protein